MIVISGALVLVALVLLVIGLISSALGFVYASIAVSVVSFAFLIVGILQRRGEQVPEAAPVPAATSANDVEGLTAIIPASRRPATDVSAEAASPESPVEEAAEVSGAVLVVAGRPRYHVAGCRYLTGKEPEEISLDEARGEGFTACGVCKPDDALAAAMASSDDTLEVAADEAAPDPVPAARKTAAKTASRTATTTSGRTASGRTASGTAAKAPTRTAAKKAAPVAATAAAKKAAPAKKAAARKAAPAKKAAAKKTAGRG